MDSREQTSTLGTIRLALSLVWSSGARLLLLIVLTTIVTALATAGQLLAGRELLDLIADNDNVESSDLAPALIALGVLLMLSALSQAVATELRIPLSEQVQRHTMDEVLDVAAEVELEEYEYSDFHDRLQRARAGASGQSTTIVFGLVTIMSTAVVGIGVVLVLISVSPLLVAVALLGYIPVAYVNVRNNRARYQLDRELTENQRERTYLEFLLTNRNDAKEMRSYAMAPTLRGWHSALWEVRLTRLRSLVQRRLRYTTVGSFITTLALIATLAIVMILAGRGSISIGDAAVAVVGLQQLSTRLQAAGNAFTGLHQGVTFLRDFEHFRATLPVIRANRPTNPPPSPPSTLSVENLTYTYPGATIEAVRDVSFDLRRGQIMAIVGANGSGKTTLAKLLCDLLPPTEGTVAWDGVDLATCEPDQVRSQIAPVFQDFARYMFTVREDIGLGDADRLDDIDSIALAASAAGLDELLAQHDRGLETRLGKPFEGGVDISIGQWQRLAIARAMYRDAPVIVLDEPSASLDPHAEADLFDLLHTLCQNRIVIFISHRFATVRTADVVMVMDQGEIVEFGPHDELMSRQGLYADMFNLQAGRYGMLPDNLDHGAELG